MVISTKRRVGVTLYLAGELPDSTFVPTPLHAMMLPTAAHVPMTFREPWLGTTSISHPTMASAAERRRTRSGRAARWK